MTTYTVRHRGDVIEITGRNLAEACSLANISEEDVRVLDARRT